MAERRKQDGLKKVLGKTDAGQLYTQLNPPRAAPWFLPEAGLPYNQGHDVTMETQNVSLHFTPT